MIRSAKETIEFYESLTNRQLIRAYRELIEHINDVRTMRNNHSEFYLGDPIKAVLVSAGHDKIHLQYVLIRRGYVLANLKNIPALITLKTSDQLQAEKDEREATRTAEAKKQKEANEAAAIQPAIDAIKLFAIFQLNYPHNFIEVAFNGGMVNHLRSKFNNIYDQHGAKAAIIMFWAELDFENRHLLAKYIIDRHTKKAN